MGCITSNLGKLPSEGYELISSDDGVPHIEEHILGIMIQRDYKTPHRSCNYCKFSSPYSSLAITDNRFVAYIKGKRQVNIQFDNTTTMIEQIKFSVVDSENNLTRKMPMLLLEVDVSSLFQPQSCSGQLEFQFYTENANYIHNRIQNAMTKNKRHQHQLQHQHHQYQY